MAKAKVPDVTKRSMAEYNSAIETLVANLRNNLGFPVGVPNDEADSLAQDYALMNTLASLAEDRKQKLRKELLEVLPIPQVKGTHPVHDGAFAIVMAQVVNNPARLSEAAVVNMLVREFALPVEAAQKLVGECKTQTEGYQTRLTATLKR